jgi:hypothetical protein
MARFVFDPPDDLEENPRELLDNPRRRRRKKGRRSRRRSRSRRRHNPFASAPRRRRRSRRRSSHRRHHYSRRRSNPFSFGGGGVIGDAMHGVGIFAGYWGSRFLSTIAYSKLPIPASPMNYTLVNVGVSVLGGFLLKKFLPGSLKSYAKNFVTGGVVGALIDGVPSTMQPSAVAHGSGLADFLTTSDNVGDAEPGMLGIGDYITEDGTPSYLLNQ